MRLGRGEVGEGIHRGAHALLDRAVAVEGAEDRLRCARGDIAVGTEQELFLVGVQLVEGRPRDVRELGQIEDAHALVAALRDELGHRALQSLALVALDLLAGHAMRTGRQPPVAIGRALALDASAPVVLRGTSGRGRCSPGARATIFSILCLFAHGRRPDGACGQTPLHLSLKTRIDAKY